MTSRQSGLPLQTAQQLLLLVRALSNPEFAPPHGRDRSQAMAILDLALQVPRLAHHVIRAIVEQHLGSPTLGEALREHQSDETWGKPYPLAVQEYTPLVRRSPLLHLGLVGLMQQTAWPRHGLLALSEAVANQEGVADAAQELAKDFTLVSEDLHVLYDRLQRIKVLKSKSNMHVAQVEAFLAAQLTIPRLEGAHVLDVGCGGGELVAAFSKAGAIASGSEMSEDNLLGVDEEPHYDIVTATALFEPGAFAWPGTGINTWAFEQHSDAIIESAARLLKPGGVLVVRNISSGMPFTARAVSAAGLTYERVLVPTATPTFGGRLAVWRKRQTRMGLITK